MRSRHRLPTLVVLLLIPTLTRADPIGFVTLGDSLTESYAAKPYAGTNRSWTDLLLSERGGYFDLTNKAKEETTSAALIAGGQHTSAAGAKVASLAVGANDVLAFLYQLDPTKPATLDPTPHVAGLVGNVATAVATLKASGAQVILANVPNVMDTPAMKAALAGQPGVAWLLTAMTDSVNAELARLAASQRLALVDLRKLNAVGNGPFLLGGIDVQSHLYSVDGFHPSTVGSGLLANVILEALASYGVEVPRLTDAEILARAGLKAADPSAAFNAGAYVMPPAPEPTSLVLLGVGAAALVAARRRAVKCPR